jgi:hypothetical protein
MFNIKSLFTVIYIVSCMGLMAQNQYKGQVISKQANQPVPFAFVTDEHRKWGISTDENGYFVLDERPVGDTLIVGCLGFFEYKVSFSQWKNPMKIFLSEKPFQLQEVIIENNRKKHTLWLGSQIKTTTRSVGQISFPTVQEIAVLIPNYLQSEGYIHKVGYWISRLGKHKTPFRVRIYKNQNGMPGEDLLQENLIVHARKGNNWFDIDVSKYNIPIPNEGFFISMEWIYSANPKYSYEVTWPNKKVITHFGQNIGRAIEFNENLSRIRNNGGQWRIYNADMQPVINPMMRVQIQIYE